MDLFKALNAHFKKVVKTNSHQLIQMETYQGYVYYGNPYVLVKSKTDKEIKPQEQKANLSMDRVDNRFFHTEYENEIVMNVKLAKNMLQVLCKASNSVNPLMKFDFNGDEVLVDWIDKSKKTNTPLRSCKIGLSNKVDKPITFGFNTILLRDVFMLLNSLKAKQVTVKYQNNTLRPIMLEIDDTQIVVAPVRFVEASV